MRCCYPRESAARRNMMTLADIAIVQLARGDVRGGRSNLELAVPKPPVACSRSRFVRLEISTPRQVVALEAGDAVGSVLGAA